MLSTPSRLPAVGQSRGRREACVLTTRPEKPWVRGPLGCALPLPHTRGRSRDPHDRAAGHARGPQHRGRVSAGGVPSANTALQNHPEPQRRLYLEHVLAVNKAEPRESRLHVVQRLWRNEGAAGAIFSPGPPPHPSPSRVPSSRVCPQPAQGPNERGPRPLSSGHSWLSPQNEVHRTQEVGARGAPTTRTCLMSPCAVKMTASRPSSV